MQLLDLQDLRARRGQTMVVDLSRFGLGAVRIRKLTMRMRDQWVQAATEKNNVATACKLLELSFVEPALTPETAQDFADQDAELVDYLIAAILKFNGMTQEAAKELERGFPAGRGSAVSVPAGAEAADVGAASGT